MAVLLRRGHRRGCRLLDSLLQHSICRNCPCSTICTHEGTRKHDSATHGHIGFLVLSPESTSNVNAINNKAPKGLSFKMSGYIRSFVNRFHSTPCRVHATDSLHKTIPKDGVSCDGGVFATSNAMKGLSHSKHFYSCELASVTGSKLETKTYGGILFGFGGRKHLSWTGWRPFSSLTDVQTSVSSSPMDQVEAETDSVSAEDTEDFDFTNFPALKSSFFENYEPPNEILVRRKRVTWQTKATSSAADKRLTVDSIPKARTYDFGMGTLAAKPPPLEAGARPQGRFDIDITFNEQEVDNCDSSVLQRQSWLPSKISELNKSSECKKDSPTIKDQNPQGTVDRDFQFTEDGSFQSTEDRILDHEQDLLWDPYNVSDEQGLQLCKSSELLN